MDLANVLPSLLQPNSDHMMVDLGSYKHGTYNWLHASMYKQDNNNCNLQNEPSHDLKWVGTNMSTHKLNPSGINMSSIQGVSPCYT